MWILIYMAVGWSSYLPTPIANFDTKKECEDQADIRNKARNTLLFICSKGVPK